MRFILTYLLTLTIQCCFSQIVYTYNSDTTKTTRWTFSDSSIIKLNQQTNKKNTYKRYGKVEIVANTESFKMIKVKIDTANVFIKWYAEGGFKQFYLIPAGSEQTVPVRIKRCDNCDVFLKPIN